METPEEDLVLVRFQIEVHINLPRDLEMARVTSVGKQLTGRIEAMNPVSSGNGAYWVKRAQFQGIKIGTPTLAEAASMRMAQNLIPPAL